MMKAGLQLVPPAAAGYGKAVAGMPENRRIALICAAMICLLLLMSNGPYFNVEKHGLVQLRVCRQQEQQDEWMDVAVASYQRYKPCEPFTPDEANIYTINTHYDPETDACYKSLADENDRPCDGPEVTQEIFAQIDKLAYATLDMWLIEAKGEFFLFVQRNAGISSTSLFYYYNTQKQKLILLCGLEAQIPGEIRVVSAERLRRLE